MAKHSDMADGRRGAERLIAKGVDCIAAGFPCQDISFAGEGAGLTGSRSGLVWNLLRTIRLVRPRWAVLENVAALLGRGLDQILGHMASVGYDAEWHCIPASAVGAPHQRDRIWIIATDAGSQQHQGGSPPISGAITKELSCALADASPVFGSALIGNEQNGNHAGPSLLANSESAGLSNGQQAGQPPRSDEEIGTMALSELERRSGAWWGAEPDVGRVADGVPSRVDRLRCLGNAVVPQIPEIIGRAIMSAERL